MGCIQQRQKQGRQNSQQHEEISQIQAKRQVAIDEPMIETKYQGSSQKQNIYEQAFRNEIINTLMRVDIKKKAARSLSVRKKSSTTISPVHGILKNSNSSPSMSNTKQRHRVNFSISSNFSTKENIRIKSKSLCKKKQL